MAELDADYIAKMEDVLALYERPYNMKEPVVCLDEKPVSLHADVQPPRPARPGHIAKRDNEYRRCGTANIFAIVEPQAGRHFTCATPDRSAQQFARVVERVIVAYPRARTITDHWGRRLGRRLWRRLTVHFTPKHGSWLNQAEIELSLVSRGCLGSRRLDTLANLRRETHAWNRRANRSKTRIRWLFTRKNARTKFGYQKNLSNRSKT